MHQIEELDAEAAERELPALAAVMQACVAGGASVNFVLPFSQSDSEAWWRRVVLPGLAGGERRLLVARVAGRIMGSVQLAFAPQPNQPHRAEVTKLLVHPEGRRRGLARALMTGIEAQAREHRRTLLTLDTTEGSEAERLYLSLGYVKFGVVPRYARAPEAPRLEGASFFYKELA
jgi:ribosomal protein S18 acetylase RimI-like enzyme